MKRIDLKDRRDRIVTLLSEVAELSASELSERLDVSVQTIRTDLRDLDDAGLVQRRNGAARLRQHSENIAYSPRESISRQEKQHIAMAVKNLVEDGAHIALGTGTTVEHCARLLAVRKDLFVATNSLHAVVAMQNAPGAVVELAGGMVRLRDLDLIGSASMEFFSRFHLDQAVFSCGGISAGGDVLDYNSDEILARRSIGQCAREKILVVDSTKFGLDMPCGMHKIWDYDVVVSGQKLAVDLLERCKTSGCRIIEVQTMGQE
ncbi:DeoR/GlpR family DNA-binding transcription regulator [Phaeobacter sp. C3_T13_0]|uniref:DeoR/GlpR family DNA-binding transcription regulator n=1 Tax=Phaeobacter cretensis TaxID=3342641 RepID=UPI0039BD2101